MRRTSSHLWVELFCRLHQPENSANMTPHTPPGEGPFLGARRKACALSPLSVGPSCRGLRQQYHLGTTKFLISPRGQRRTLATGVVASSRKFGGLREGAIGE